MSTKCPLYLGHALLQLLRYLMQPEEVLQVAQLGLILRPTRVHSLYDRGHVTEHDRVHQRADQHRHHREYLTKGD